MATNGQRYAVDIGSGAAGGAAAGTAILPGWGTAIGAGVGAIGGAISAGFGNSQEANAKKRLEQAQQRSREDIKIDLWRNYAAKHGVDTTYLDTLRAMKGEDRQEAAENAQFAAQNRIDPSAFVPIAVNGAKAAGGLYKAGLSSPSSPYGSFGQPGGDFNTSSNQQFTGPATQDASSAYAGADVSQMLPMQPSQVGGQLYPQDDQQDWYRGLA
jgi:hypothetical protein